MSELNTYEEQLIKLIKEKKESEALVFYKLFKNKINPICEVDSTEYSVCLPFMCVDNKCWDLLNKLMDNMESFKIYRAGPVNSLLSELVNEHQWELVEKILIKELTLPKDFKTVNHVGNTYGNFMFDLIDCEQEKLATLALKCGFENYNVSVADFINNPEVCYPMVHEHTDVCDSWEEKINNINKICGTNKRLEDVGCVEYYAAKHNMYELVTAIQQSDLKLKSQKKTFVERVLDKINFFNKQSSESKPKI
jgi:hypothetical protein